MSALVLPERMPVRNAGQQGMFPEDEFPQDQTTLLLKLLTNAVGAVTALTELNHDLVKANGRKATSEQTSARTPAERTGYGPTNAKHRTWRGFCLDMQRIQRELPKTTKPTKENFAMRGPDSVKTISRTMRGYGKNPRDWPPEDWDPDEDRVWRSPD